jgi:3D (Asp-Asp-Asp) domain-containing protein
MRRLLIALAMASSTAACGTQTLEVHDPDASTSRDAASRDSGSSARDAGDPEPDIGAPVADAGPGDTGTSPEDVGAPDVGVDPEPDAGEPDEPWPQFSGTVCDVAGSPGVCLPTSRCGGRSVPGHCPGPADMQCCLAGCELAGDPGRCVDGSQCASGAQASAACEGPDGVVCCPAPEGTPIGTLWNTYYYLSVESEFSGPDDTTLYDSSCDPVAQVPAAFSDAACIEGSGRLTDGTVVNYASTCSCGRPCPTGGTVCWAAVDAARFPWGQGARSNPLVPLRSLAVDRDFIALGTSLYLPAWDGYAVPRVGDVGGFTHDGCFEAADVGGAIDGNHVDIFSGTAQMRQTLEGVFPTRTDFDAYVNSPRCP